MNVSGEWSNAVEAARPRIDAVEADQPKGRPDPGDAQPGCRNANGSTRIGARTPETKPSGNRGAGSARRTPGRTVQVPRIMRVAEGRICAGHASGKLVHVGLAKNDNTSIQELPYYCRVAISRTILESLRSNRCPRPAHLEEVFDHDRHAVQRPAVLASAHLRIPLSRRLERLLLENRNKGVELRLKLLDTGEVRVGEIE